MAIRENLNPVEEGCRETLSPPALRSHRYFDRAVVVVAGGGRRVEDEGVVPPRGSALGGLIANPPLIAQLCQCGGGSGCQASCATTKKISTRKQNRRFDIIIAVTAVTTVTDAPHTSFTIKLCRI